MLNHAPPDCTLLLAVDDKHLGELVTVFPTWAVCHPEILSFPLVMLYDNESVSPDDPRISCVQRIRRRFGSRAPLTLIAWPPPGLSWRSHREKMLLAYVKGADYVRTPWFLKIDTDAVATRRKAFIDPRWFATDIAFISNPVFRINYTLGQLERFESWAEGVEPLRGLPQPDYLAHRDSGRPIKICSWLMFGNTAWFRWVSSFCTCLPVPSQDSFHSYVAMKSSSKWLAVKFKRYGWKHKISKNYDISPLLAKCPAILQRYGYHASEMLADEA